MWCFVWSSIMKIDTKRTNSTATVDQVASDVIIGN